MRHLTLRGLPPLSYLYPLKFQSCMLKIGVFGVGHLGKFHLNNWKEIAGVEIIGFYDPHDDTASEVSEKYQLARFLDPDALIDACDAIDVVAPTTYHFTWCEKAIKKAGMFSWKNPWPIPWMRHACW